MIQVAIEGETITKQIALNELNRLSNELQANDSLGVVVISVDSEKPEGITLCYKMSGPNVIEALLDLAEQHDLLGLIVIKTIQRLHKSALKGGDAPKIF